MALATVVVQDLTYTERRLAIGVTVSYVAGGVAGAEVVTVSDKAISVVIEDGVSTAAQIKAAVDASTDAMLLVSVAVSGTGTNAQKAGVSTIASGTAAALFASKTIGDLVYTAKTAGAAGNSIRIKYVQGTSLAVNVSTNDITITLDNSPETTGALLKAAVEGTPAAHALVGVTSAGPALSNVVKLAACVAFTALAGGVSLAAGSAVLQDVTVTTRANTAAHNGKTVSYSAGATAGAEVVTVSASGVNVQIETGVTTATQVVAACDAAATFVGVKATGSITYGTPVVGDTVVVGGTVFTYRTAVSEVKATGSITFGIPVEGDTVTVAGSTFTYSTTPGANIFADISELEALVEGVTGINSTQDGTTVAITSTLVGVLGNAQTLSRTGTGTLAVSGATLTGGVDAYVLVATDFDNIVALEALVEAVTNLTSSQNGTVVSITYNNYGTAGNAVTLARTGTGTMTVSGPNLTGGTDLFIASVSGTGSTAQVVAKDLAASGASGTAPYAGLPVRVTVIS